MLCDFASQCFLVKVFVHGAGFLLEFAIIRRRLNVFNSFAILYPHFPAQRDENSREPSHECVLAHAIIFYRQLQRSAVCMLEAGAGLDFGRKCKGR